MKEDGSVWAWGNNEYYTIGDDSVYYAYVPAKVNNLDNVISIATGRSHNLVLKNNGEVFTFGNNFNG